MAIIPNRIVLISNGRHDEAIADLDCWPGQILIEKSNLNVIPHNIAGGGGQLLMAKEDALQGLNITQKLPATNNIPFHRPTRGDYMLGLLQNGQNVARAVNLMSAGDGSLIVNPGSKLYQINAASTTYNTSTAELTFSNGSYTIPANFLQVGDVIHARCKVTCTGVTATPTFTVKLYIGATVLKSTGAIAMIAADVAIIDVYITVRTITATGTIIADGTFVTEATGTFTTNSFTLASTTLDSTIAEIMKVTGQCSASSASNTYTLDEFQIDLNRAAGLNTILVSDEAINNSGGTGTSGFNSAAFIRCFVP